MATRAYGAEREVERPINGNANVEAAQPGTGDATAKQSGVEPQDPGGATDHPGEGGTVDPAAVANQAKQRADAKERKRIRANKAAREYQRKKAAERKAGGAETAGAATRKSAAQATIDLNNILFSLHMMGAAVLKIPSLALTEEEAKRLATAITRVTELYEVPILDEKTRAWLNLSIVGFEVYGTRVVAAMAERKKKEPAPPPMVITPFRPITPPRPPQEPIEAFAQEVNSVGQA